MTTKPYTEKQLFDSLISQSAYGIWIALGKVQNPMTNEMSVDLIQASAQIDALDMMNNRMHASLTDKEKEYFKKLLSELKLNYVEVEKAEEVNTVDKEKQLFDSLIKQSEYGVLIALGKVQNPMTNEMSVDLMQASIQIDMLNMMNSRMHDSLAEQEKEDLEKLLSKLNEDYKAVEKAEDAKPIEETSSKSTEETKKESEK
jgi:hypothetical protein